MSDIFDAVGIDAGIVLILVILIQLLTRLPTVQPIRRMSLRR